MTTAKFKLEPLTCPSCIKKIEGKIGKMQGVQSAAVLFHSSKVKVEFDEKTVTAGEIRDTITALGYPVLD